MVTVEEDIGYMAKMGVTKDVFRQGMIVSGEAILSNKNLGGRFSSLLFFLLIGTVAISCRKEKIVYKKMSIKIIQKLMIGKGDFYYNWASISENTIFFVRNGIWKVTLGERLEKIINEGVGPEEVYAPNKIHCTGKACWINSYYPLSYIYKLNSENNELERVSLGSPFYFDDFQINRNWLVIINPYWKDNLVKILDLEKAEIVKACGKRYFIPLMKKFNVNEGNILVLNGNIVANQSILNEISIFSKECSFERKVKFNPPFYKPMPSKYRVEKFDDEAHRKWMSKWTNVYKLLGSGNWILVIYRLGYEKVYFYEYFNPNHSRIRYFSGRSKIEMLNLRGKNFVGMLDDGEKLWLVKGKFCF